jgi:hypothetical protein
MNHDQTFVKKPVAKCLGLLDGAAARDALLFELLKPSVSMEVRTECIASLRSQFLRLENPLTRLAFRLVLFEGVWAAKQTGCSLVATELEEIATRENLLYENDWPANPLAVQALPTLAPLKVWKVSGTFADPQEYPLPIASEVFLTAAEMARIGEPRETKYRVVGVENGSPEEVRLTVVPTDWVSSRAFHILVGRNIGEIAKAMKRWPEPVPVGTDWLPGLLAVHCIVVSSDSQMLLVRRSTSTAYYPGHWSVSFEEQVITKDFQEGGDFAASAARRGFSEEFGEDLRIRSLSTLSGLIETGILNFGVVVLLHADETATSICKRWQAEPRPKDHQEATEIRHEPMARFSHPSEVLSGLPLHPTSELRLAIWRHWHRMTE